MPTNQTLIFGQTPQFTEWSIFVGVAILVIHSSLQSIYAAATRPSTRSFISWWLTSVPPEGWIRNTSTLLYCLLVSLATLYFITAIFMAGFFLSLTPQRAIVLSFLATSVGAAISYRVSTDRRGRSILHRVPIYILVLVAMLSLCKVGRTIKIDPNSQPNRLQSPAQAIQKDNEKTEEFNNEMSQKIKAEMQTLTVVRGQEAKRQREVNTLMDLVKKNCSAGIARPK
jgi:hypothetical protein